MKINLADTPMTYINMDKDTDRNDSMQVLIDEFKFSKAARSSGEYVRGDSLKGCATSHYNILSAIKGKHIILEDDCVIKNNQLIIEVPDDADAVYLGLSSWGYLKDVSKPGNHTFEQVANFPGIYKVNGMLATHAILYISKDYIKTCERIAKYSADNSVHVDQGFARVQRYFNVYAIADPIFYQDSNTESTRIKFVKNRMIEG
jgi:hypothetical protein